MKYRFKTTFIGWLFAAFFSLNLAYASPIKVVTTTNIVHELVLQIGGDKIQAEALMGPGVDPHFYKATFGDMRKLAHADIVFYNGLHLEGRMQSVFDNLSSMKPVVGLGYAIEQHQLLKENDIIDPHFWLDVRLWRQAMDEVVLRLTELAPQHADYFDARADMYLNELNQLDQWIRQQISTIPESRRLLISAHNAFGYYGAAYNIEVLGLQGINTTTEYGLQDLRHLKDVIKKRKIKAVFIESSVSERAIESLIAGVNAEGGKVALGGQLYSDALGSTKSGAGSYIGMMRYNTRTIVKALK